MARYDHLRLVRLPERIERRKRPGFGKPVARDPQTHGVRLKAELEATIEVQRHRRRPAVVTPSLILRVQMTGPLLEEDWQRLGLTVLATDADRTLILFASSDELIAFRERLHAYSSGVPAGKKHPAYASFVACIERIGSVEARDRIGPHLRAAGFTEPADFPDAEERVLDIELWDLGHRSLRQSKLTQISTIVLAAGGDVLDEYSGPTISILRVKAGGELIRDLLTIEDVASIDLPPELDTMTNDALALELPHLPPIAPVDDDAPVIGIIDSGVNAHPLIGDSLVGAIGVPERLGYADVYGHGTRVAGVSALGDLRQQLASGTLVRAARLCSAKVTTDRGGFDERALLPSQMREAIATLHTRYGCRIFVVALGDRLHPYTGGKLGAWAATLDELARELDVLICVAAGNRAPRGGDEREQAITDYPHYLTAPENGFFEPAGAVNVLTVGSLAHGPGIDAESGQYAQIRAITRQGEPSPFTRVGPGVGGSIKPDVVDYGGTLVFDAARTTLRKGDSEDLPSAGLLTLHHRPTERLFASGAGTSYAAPLVALKASQILRTLPRASANLLRALMVGAAHVPDQAQKCLTRLGEPAIRAVCGHGRIDLERAAYSDDSRVVLYAEDELSLDYFAVYEVPVPELFQSAKGRRHVRVTLAFDPPVRHTRNDYLGVKMSFRLKRGCSPDLVFEHYRKRSENEGPVPEIAQRYDCKLLPGPDVREKGTVQTAYAAFKRDITEYGDRYYLVVRCESSWAATLPEQKQRFAVVVELAHEAEIQLYDRVRVRVRA